MSGEEENKNSIKSMKPNLFQKCKKKSLTNTKKRPKHQEKWSINKKKQIEYKNFMEFQD